LLQAAKGNVTWVYNHAFFVILNLAVGGNFGQGDTGSLPPESKMLIDYVHVTDSSTPPTGGPTGNPPTGSTSALKGAGSGRCIDVPGANSANGTRLAIFDCNGTGAQQWTLATDGTARALGKCMDAAAAGTANGTAVQLYDCNGTGAQKFTLSAAGDLVNSASGKCVDVTNNGTANSSPLQLWTCSGSPNQKWSKA
jgi:hypothetical protein